MSREDSSAISRGLPLSSWLVIITAAAVLFLLGTIYLSQQAKQLDVVYQVLGSGKLVVGRPAAFRVITFDMNHNELSPLSILSAGLSQGDHVIPGKVADQTAMNDSSVEFPPLDFTTGTARLDLEVSSWEGRARRISLVLDVLETSDFAWTFTPAAADPGNKVFRRLELTPFGRVVLGERTNPFWLRISDQDDHPVRGDVRIMIDGQAGPELTVDRSGLGIVQLPLSRPNHQVLVQVTAADGGLGDREEMVAPMGVMRILADPPLVSLPEETGTELIIESQTVGDVLYCGLWSRGNLARLFRVNTRDGIGRYRLDLPEQGLYQVACNDHVLAGRDWLGEAWILASRDPADSVRRLLSGILDEETFFLGWDSPSGWSRDQLLVSAAYLLDRIEPGQMDFSLIHSTREGDTQEIKAEIRRTRTIILVLIALVGLSLVLWAVAQVLRNRKSMGSMNLEAEALEGMGDDLGTAGLARKGQMIPLLILLLAAMVNVGSLIYVLILILY